MAERFGRTPWGRAWVDALEQRGALDPNRLPRGRTYARQDRVARLEIEPGRITALVRGTRALPYRVTVGVRPFDDATWAVVTRAVAARAAHAAALLDGELDPTIVDDVREAGVELFPGPGDLQVRCSCPDRADPCKHAAAVCYLTAREVDADPFAFFALRGRERPRLLDEVRAWRQRGPDATPDTGSGVATSGSDGGLLVDPGVTARTAWSRWLDRREAADADPSDPATPGASDVPAASDVAEKGAPPLPRIGLPDAPGTPAAWPADPPPDAPFTGEGLRRLAADAAERAWSQLADGAPSGLTLPPEADLARRAARREDAGESLVDLARAAERTPTALVAAAAVWRHAGADGVLAAGDALWRPPATTVDAARRAFLDAGVEAKAIQVRSNRVTVGDVQLRVTADGRWWRYERRERAWELVEAPSSDPSDLVGEPL